MPIISYVLIHHPHPFAIVCHFTSFFLKSFPYVFINSFVKVNLASLLQSVRRAKYPVTPGGVQTIRSYVTDIVIVRIIQMKPIVVSAPSCSKLMSNDHIQCCNFFFSNLRSEFQITQYPMYQFLIIKELLLLIRKYFSFLCNVLVLVFHPEVVDIIFSKLPSTLKIIS